MPGMKRIKLLAIVPYEGLREIINESAKAFADLEVDTYIGDMYEGLHIAQELQHNGYVAIISRAGTAELIETVANIPVIRIQISVCDMLRAIKLAQNYIGESAVVGFKAIGDCAKSISDLMQYSLEIHTIDSEDDLKNCFSDLKEQGISLIIGDVITTLHAKHYGFNTILVMSGRESVDAALAQVINWYDTIAESRQYVQAYRSILDHSMEITLVFNPNGDLFYMTPQLPVEDERHLSMFLSKYVPALQERGRISLLKKVGKNYWNIHGHCIEPKNLVAFYCKRGDVIGKIDRGSLTYRNYDDLPYINFETFYAKSPCLKETLENARKYGDSALPVIIFGGVGSGKDAIAYATSSRGALRDAPFVKLDCQFIDDKQWKILLKDPDSPLGYENYTIYIKNMQCLSEQQALALETYFDNTLVYKRNRLLFSYIPKAQNAFEKSTLLDYIYDKIGALPLSAPRLDEYAEDISSLASIYLNELNVQFGRQVIGFEAGAIEMMGNFHWFGNLKQFRHVMRELIILTEGDYISKAAVAAALQKQLARNLIETPSLALNGTLSDIENSIIRAVLEEEGMNQSKAAKRLGISRSTLWRKL